MSGTLEITIEPERLTAVLRRGRAIRWSAAAEYDDNKDLASALAALAAERPRRVHQASVCLGPELARVKTVAGLPPLKQADLAAHVRLHSRRYFLQNGVPLVTDATVVRGATAATLAGAPVPLIEAVTDGLAMAGLECLDIAPQSRPDLSLLLDVTRAARRKKAEHAIRQWAFAAVASVVLAAATWAYSLRHQGERAEAELLALKPSLDLALAVRRDIDAADQALGVISAAQAHRSRDARFLARIAEALPDSAFIVSIHLDPGGVSSMSGYAPRAAAVAALLERRHLITQPIFEGAVSREVMAGRDLERFAIRFTRPDRVAP